MATPPSRQPFRARWRPNAVTPLKFRYVKRRVLTRSIYWYSQFWGDLIILRVIADNVSSMGIPEEAMFERVKWASSALNNQVPSNIFIFLESADNRASDGTLRSCVHCVLFWQIDPEDGKNFENFPSPEFWKKTSQTPLDLSYLAPQSVQSTP